MGRTRRLKGWEEYDKVYGKREREIDLIHVSPTYLMHSTLITFKIQGQVTAARISPHLKSNANVRVDVQFQK